LTGLHSPVFSGDEKAELQDAYLSTRRLKRLTEDLTKYAEDVRFGRLNPQVFALNVLQNQVQFDFSAQFTDKNLEFHVEFLPETCADWQVYGDYYRISQVCNNFVGNAVKFTPSGGRIQMRVRARGKLEKTKVATDGASEHSSASVALFRTPLTDDSNSDKKGKDQKDWHVEYFEFEVEDNGIGIPAEDLGKIFEPWHQLADDKQHNEKYGGIGLGLAICQFWITKMDGKIEVTSRRAASMNERGWTIFKVLIPLRVNRLSRRNSINSSKMSIQTVGSDLQAAPTAHLNRPESPKAPQHEIKPQELSEAMTVVPPQPPTLKISQKQSCRILIAEDEPINQRVVQRMLTKDGFRRITFARNGFEAIEAVSKAQEAGKQFNLILMDFQMPHLDGPLATTVIRRMPHITQDHLVIIALTAYDDDKSKRDCLEAGMNDFITKPISHAVLRDTLMRHLSLPSVPEDEDEDEAEDEIRFLNPSSAASPSNENPPPVDPSSEI
jgi:osomolarity two-component system, sensor histidine kinase SLN1